MAKRSTKKTVYPTCALLVPCDAVFVDPNSNKPNLFGLFDKLTPQSLPASVQFSLFTKLVGGNGKFPLTIALIDPSGKPVEGASLEIEQFECKPKQIAKIGGMFRVELRTKGEYKLVVRSGSTIIGESMPIPVELKAT
jgi:hypothetical protein